MANNHEFYVTESGLAEMKKELDYLKLERRPEVISALKDARALGDLSENAEYDAARNEQAVVESKIQELEVLIDNAVIIKEIKTDKVSLGTTVKIEYVEDHEEETFSIVGVKEVDPFSNKISNESPIAKAIMNHKVGDTATVISPNGQYDVRVLAIS